MFEIEETIFNENLAKWLFLNLEGLFVIINGKDIIGYTTVLEDAYFLSVSKVGHKNTFIKEIKHDYTEKSPYDQMTLDDKVKFAAHESAVKFLNYISKESYDQEHSPLHGTLYESKQPNTFREEIPVNCDINVNSLEDLLYDFYKGKIEFLKEEVLNGK